VQLVEFAPFPRSRADQQRRVGFTRDVSNAGMCLAVAHGEPVGSLLHVTVRCVDGRPTLDSLARVVWLRSLENGDCLMGLQVLGERAGLLRAPRRLPADRIAAA
jgi:hypothetical protein